MNPKMNKYLHLLNDLNIIRKVEGGYKDTPKFISLKKSYNLFEPLKIAIYSNVLSEGYETLRHYFNFRFIDSYLKIENSYYADAVESNKILKRREDEMFKSYLKRYVHIPEYKFYPHLQELISVESFNTEDSGSIFGVEQIFNSVYESREREIDFAKILY